jgi:pyruvate,water dikinase
VIDVPSSTSGQILRVAMNADEEKALGYLAAPSERVETAQPEVSPALQADSDFHWRWRLQSAETISSHLDPQRFGVKAFYIFGSTKNATAGPGSDIDILIHFQGNEDQRKELLTWLEGWSLSLGQINYLRTGVQSAGLLDVHLVTDADIKKGTSYAAKIGAVTDAARPLSIGTALKPKRAD